MKKENILVVVLIVIALASILVYKQLKGPAPVVQSQQGVLNNGETSPPQAGDIAEAGAGIDWKDFTPGTAMARTQNKDVFLYFHAPWCTYCKKLAATTFKDPAVLAYLKEHFISIQVDTDQNRDMASRWQVSGLPTLWFLDTQGNKIDKIPGYVSAPQLMLILKFIHTKSYESMSFQDFMKQN